MHNHEAMFYVIRLSPEIVDACFRQRQSCSPDCMEKNAPPSPVSTYTGASMPVQFHLLVLNCHLHSSPNVAITSDKTTIARGTSRHNSCCVAVRSAVLHINSASKLRTRFRQQQQKQRTYLQCRR